MQITLELVEHPEWVKQDDVRFFSNAGPASLVDRTLNVLSGQLAASGASMVGVDTLLLMGGKVLVTVAYVLQGEQQRAKLEHKMREQLATLEEY